MTAVRFPFERQRSTVFGIVHRPVVRVDLWSTRTRGWVGVVMLVDTGADYTLLPSLYSGLLGVDLKRGCRRVATGGIGGTETVHLLPRLRMRLGPWSRRIPVGFLERDDVPPLLGRMGCLDTFDVRFLRRHTTFASPDRD